MTRRSREAPFGNSPTTRVRRLIWLLSVSQVLDVRVFVRCSSGMLKTAKPSGMLVSAQSASLDCVGSRS